MLLHIISCFDFLESLFTRIEWDNGVWQVWQHHFCEDHRYQIWTNSNPNETNYNLNNRFSTNKRQMTSAGRTSIHQIQTLLQMQYITIPFNVNLIYVFRPIRHYIYHMLLIRFARYSLHLICYDLINKIVYMEKDTIERTLNS